MGNKAFDDDARAQEEGLFDQQPRGQDDLFQSSKAGPDAPKKAGNTRGNAHDN